MAQGQQEVQGVLGVNAAVGAGHEETRVVGSSGDHAQHRYVAICGELRPAAGWSRAWAQDLLT